MKKASRPYRMQARSEAAERTGRVILASAAALWRESAFEDLTLQAIAERAGVSVQTVIRRYGSKEGVVQACMEQDAAGVVAERERAPVGDLGGALAVLLRHYERDGDTVLRPLVVVGLSSTFQDQRGALQRVASALGTLEVRGLLTLGPAMEGAALDLPENVIAVASTSHAQVFPHASAVVTHAGHGTVMRALAQSLPLLCLPMGRDQDDNAARVVAHGVGLRLRPSASPARIASALRRLLGDPTFRANAEGHSAGSSPPTPRPTGPSASSKRRRLSLGEVLRDRRGRSGLGPVRWRQRRRARRLGPHASGRPGALSCARPFTRFSRRCGCPFPAPDLTSPDPAGSSPSPLSPRPDRRLAASPTPPAR